MRPKMKTEKKLKERDRGRESEKVSTVAANTSVTEEKEKRKTCGGCFRCKTKMLSQSTFASPKNVESLINGAKRQQTKML